MVLRTASPTTIVEILALVSRVLSASSYRLHHPNLDDNLLHDDTLYRVAMHYFFSLHGHCSPGGRGHLFSGTAHSSSFYTAHQLLAAVLGCSFYTARQLGVTDVVRRTLMLMFFFLVRFLFVAYPCLVPNSKKLLLFSRAEFTFNSLLFSWADFTFNSLLFSWADFTFNSLLFSRADFTSPIPN